MKDQEVERGVVLLVVYRMRLLNKTIIINVLTAIIRRK